jgi:hypothetical protein
MNIAYRSLRVEWKDILTKWFNCYGKMEDVFELYLTVVLAPDLADHHKFLFLPNLSKAFIERGQINSRRQEDADRDFHRPAENLFRSVLLFAL